MIELAILYFTRRGYAVDKNPFQDENLSAKRFDLIIRRRSEVYPVCVKDWNRTVGVNIIINVDKAAENSGFSNPIVVAEKFSEHAKAYASRRGIKLVTKTDILRGRKAF